MSASKLKQQLRQHLRQQRQQLTPTQIAAYAQKICGFVVQSELFAQAEHIAIYWPFDGEVDPRSIANIAWQQQKYCYLPVVVTEQQLHFCPYLLNSTLQPNQFGIPEPQCNPGEECTVETLSLLFMPLVGFSTTGTRLGMGGGFYDRSLASLYRDKETKPKLVGLGYSFQQAEEIPYDKWDIRLDYVVTENGWIAVNN